MDIIKLIEANITHKSNLSRFMVNNDRRPVDVHQQTLGNGEHPVMPYNPPRRKDDTVDVGGLKTKRFGIFISNIVSLLENDSNIADKIAATYDKYTKLQKRDNEYKPQLEDPNIIKLDNINKKINYYETYINSTDTLSPDLLEKYKQELKLALADRSKLSKLITNKASESKNTMTTNERTDARLMKAVLEILKESAFKLYNKFPTEIQQKAKKASWLSQYSKFRNSPHAQATVLRAVSSNDDSDNPIALYFSRLQKKYDVDKRELLDSYGIDIINLNKKLFTMLPSRLFYNLLWNDERNNLNLRLKNKKEDTVRKQAKKPALMVRGLKIINALGEMQNDMVKYDEFKSILSKFINDLPIDEHRKEFYMKNINGDFYTIDSNHKLISTPLRLAKALRSQLNEMR